MFATVVFGQVACDDDETPARVIDAATGGGADAAGQPNLDTATGMMSLDTGTSGGQDMATTGGMDAGTTTGMDAATTTTADAGTDAPAGATFTNIYNNILVVRCSPCHTTATGTGVVDGKLDMTTRAKALMNLVNVPGGGSACAGQGTRVIPMQGGNSLIYLKLSPDEPVPCGAKMPLGRIPIPDTEIELIEEWIDDGAEDN
jgi:hypothetical protein